MALADALASATRRPFTFCYLSGMGADQSESSWLPWEKLTRHIKGRTEKDLLALQSRHQQFHVHCYRPGGILPLDTGRLSSILLAPIAIRVDTLARALIVGATDPALADGWPVIANSQIKQLARRS